MSQIGFLEIFDESDFVALLLIQLKARVSVFLLATSLGDFHPSVSIRSFDGAFLDFVWITLAAKFMSF